MTSDIVARSMPLTFVPHGSKWHAQTPAGEMAYGDAQGLYEWRRVRVAGADPLLFPDGMMSVRIHYTGGDRQGSSDGQMWTEGPEAPGRLTPPPHLLGFHAALSPERMN
jgi:hypothetical protein